MNIKIKKAFQCPTLHHCAPYRPSSFGSAMELHVHRDRVRPCKGTGSSRPCAAPCRCTKRWSRGRCGAWSFSWHFQFESPTKLEAKWPNFALVLVVQVPSGRFLQKHLYAIAQLQQVSHDIPQVSLESQHSDPSGMPAAWARNTRRNICHSYHNLE